MLRPICLLTLVSLFSGPLRAIVVASGDPSSSVVAYNRSSTGSTSTASLSLSPATELAAREVCCRTATPSSRLDTASHLLTAPPFRAASPCISLGRAVLSQIRRPLTSSIRSGRETPRRPTTWPSFVSIKPLPRPPPGTHSIPGSLPLLQSYWQVTGRLELGRPAPVADLGPCANATTP